MLSKKEIRQKFTKIRQRLSIELQDKNARLVLQNFTSNKIIKNLSHSAVYIAADGEIDPCHIVEHFWNKNISCYLPIMQNDKTLKFCQYTKDTPLIKNEYNIYQPQDPKYISTSILDLVILPTVCFDLDGNRIGRGEAYYDRTFTTQKMPFMLGLAHDLQKTNAICSESWDIMLNGILTEKQLYLIT